jgi:hypothetical protein
MALELDGVPILTLGDFTQLVEGLRDDAQPLGVLAAWRNFEHVDPRQLYCTLDVTCRLFLRDDEQGDVARKIIDAAVERLDEGRRLGGIVRVRLVYWPDGTPASEFWTGENGIVQGDEQTQGTLYGYAAPPPSQVMTHAVTWTRAGRSRPCRKRYPSLSAAEAHAAELRRYPNVVRGSVQILRESSRSRSQQRERIRLGKPGLRLRPLGLLDLDSNPVTPADGDRYLRALARRAISHCSHIAVYFTDDNGNALTLDDPYPQDND